MKLTTIVRWGVFLLLALLLVANATAQDDDNNKPKVLKLAPTQQGNLGLPAVVTTHLETREVTCKKYAKDTVEQLTWLDEMNCGYGKNSSGNSSMLISYNLEYNNCMNNFPRRMGEKEFNLSDISKNIEKRQKAIADCICQPYANSAVQQNNENISLGCGYKEGGRWSSDPSHHYNWCAHGGGNIIVARSWKKFQLARDNDLIKCKRPLAPTNLRPNGNTIHKQHVDLSWKDPGSKKAQAADNYQLKLVINGNASLDQTITKNNYLINSNTLPYAATIKWQVRGQNTNGYGPWSNASFKIVDGPPKIVSFKRDPDKSCYAIDEKVTLEWNVQCSLSCEVTLFGGINGNLFKLNGQPKSGSRVVAGLVQDTAYKLIVRSGTDTVIDTISVRTCSKPGSKIKTFYFKVTCPSSVDPCTPIAQPGTSSAEAKKAVLQSYGTNCTAEEIGQEEFWKACQ